MTPANRALLVVGWLLRAIALICIAWTATQVASGALTAVPAILSSVLFHGACALGGVTLVGLARGTAVATAAAPSTAVAKPGSAAGA